MALKAPRYTQGTVKKIKIREMAKATSPEDHKLFSKMAMKNYRKFIKDLAKVVTRRRESLKMSERTFAKRIGISHITMWKFENEGKIGADTIFQICTYLDIDFKIVPKSMVGEKKYFELREEQQEIHKLDALIENGGTQE